MTPDRHIALLRIARWFGGIIAGLAILLALLLWTPPGHRALEWIVTRATDGQVVVKGLDGALPGRLRVGTLELRDADGTWLRVTDASLAWSPLGALVGHYRIQDIRAAKVELLRRPLASKSSGAETPRIDVAALSLPHIDIAPSLIGHPAMLAAQGSLHYVSVHQLAADLAITRPGGSDHYTVKGVIRDDVVTGDATIAESPDGLLGRIVGLPGLGPITLAARASGDRRGNLVMLHLKAGAFSADGNGTLSLAAARADIDFSAGAPAMQLNADTSWAMLAATGHFHGTFTAPRIDAHIHIDRLHAAGVTIDAVVADARGQQGVADASATIDGLRLPGGSGDVFTKAPVKAEIHVDLKDAARPVTFAVHHPLLTLDGTAKTAGPQSVTLDASVPSLAPFAALAGQTLGGAARLRVSATRAADTITLDMQGGLDTRGASLVARMAGRAATLGFHAVVKGGDIIASRVRLHGAGFDSDIDGSFRGGRMAYRIKAALTDLSRLTPVLTGTARLSGTVAGSPAKALIALGGDADMASHGFARQHIAIQARATGLPNPAKARVTADGRLDGAKLALAADWTARTGGHDAKLSLDWKSLGVHAAIHVPQKGPLGGHATLDAKNLADIAGFTGMAMAGSVHAAGDLKAQGAKQAAQIQFAATGLHAAGVVLGALNASATVSDAFGTPGLRATLGANGISAMGFTGVARARLDGSLDKLAAGLTADLKDAQARPAHLAADALADIGKAQVRLNRLDAGWRGQTVALALPATFDLAGGAAVDRLVLKTAGGSVTLAGRLTPKLALGASAENIQLSALKTFLPLAAEGALSASADLSGSPAAPVGRVTLQGKGLRVTGYSRKLAPAELTARATLDGGTARIDASLSQGTEGTLTVKGNVPLSPDRMLDLHVAGSADLALLNPLLAAQGRQAKGRITLDAAAAGIVTAPRISGTASVKDAELQDYAQGLRVENIGADIKSDGNVIRITRFEGRAGPGTIGGSGTLDLTQPGWPVDLTITASNARPVVSDLMTASLSGDLKLTGKARQAMTLSGKLRVPRAQINLPDSFPPEVRTLNIRRRGQPPPAKPPAATTVALDLTVTATGPVTVRGHGIDADLNGRLTLSGSTGAPLIGGGFEMQRGTLNVAGQTLSFTRGKITFDGAGVRNRLDPVLDLVAETQSGGVTATLTVSGYASAPKIALSSSPQLPQDEVLSHLLFQQSAKQLSPLQLAQIAQALAALSGIGNGFDPVASIRGGLGLDRLAVSGGSGVTTGTTVEAGKYVAHNIYVGAKQGLSSGTQAQVQIDITRRLKAQATVSTGANATATQGSAAQDTGSSLGLSYQFEY